MIKEQVTPDDVVNFLNEIALIDNTAISCLADDRVPCNEALAQHPTVQVKRDGVYRKVGFLGIINGLLGTYDEGEHKGSGPITAEMDELGKIVYFRRTDDVPEEVGSG